MANIAFAHMKLSHVTIQNYLSIKEMEITFDPKCRILVGINESGKTNILKALKLLSPAANTTRKDLREAGRLEEPIRSAFVRFAFKFTDEEISQLYEQMKSSFLAKEYLTPIISIADKHQTLEGFCSSCQGLYEAEVLTGNKVAGASSIEGLKMTAPWKKVGAACPPDFSLSGSSSGPIMLKKYALVDTTDFPEIPPEYLAEATVEDFNAYALPLIKSAVQSNLPKVLFWDYEESKLLPAKINLDQFCGKPDTGVPLQRMFQLHGISDIQKAVVDAKAGGENALTNMLARVAAKTTDYFHKTWREYDQIKFSLTMNGPDLVAGIEDESNRYALAQRSDGFKRFVTFLLLVSAEEATNLLKDALLLIDEPEIGLHPSGARYLRDELIKISTNNYVVFSTHSIFMVDTRDINRHLIVKKKNEITEIEEASDANIQDEEVIYKALGYSIFSHLKERNLIFEGWRDKKLFETALSANREGYDDLRELENLGHCFAHGAKSIKNITPLFEAGDRKCLILTDNDHVAREHQREYQKNKGYGEWKRYDEVVQGAGQITGEDFLDVAVFGDVIQNLARKCGIPPLDVEDLNAQGGRINALRRWLTQSRIGADEVESSIRAAKDAVFDKLNSTSILAEYYDYLRSLLPTIRALQ